MFLAIDAGNTNVVFSLFKGEQIVHSWRCKTDAARTADEYASWLYPLFLETGQTFSVVQEAIISSVVPDVNFNLQRLCERHFKCPFFMIGNDPLQLDIKIKIDKPEEMGADRLVHAMAIKRYYKYPAIVIDFGTSTTFDVIDANGDHCGGVISPGVNLSMAALRQAAAKLPKISISKPRSVIGKDTINAMQSGMYWGCVSMLEGMIKRLSDEMREKPYVIATGGLSPLFATATPVIDMHDEDLTLKGIIAIFHHVKKQAKAA